MRYVYLTREHWYGDDPDFIVEDGGIVVNDAGGLAVIDGEETWWFSPLGWFGVTSVAPKDEDA